MSQVKIHRISLQPRSPSTTTPSSPVASLPRARRININLPSPSVTAAAFLSPFTGESTLTEDIVNQERARYTTLVSKSATSEALMKMPNVATKPISSDDIDLLAIVSSPSSTSSSSFSTDSPVACNLPRANPGPFSNLKLTVESQQQQHSSFASGYPIQGRKEQKCVFAAGVK
ncbi:hypothetical protein EC957_005080 [Mortierella hygrophila]|uniref:Uncharacterized protein n=1 Tax=Mortierella hygrophila TaxID=979708 RepID=A0A9P6F1G7_9FUNG|nr:hypothetical protein EC957_005080 [Mortierella hygrophila]